MKSADRNPEKDIFHLSDDELDDPRDQWRRNRPFARARVEANASTKAIKAQMPPKVIRTTPALVDQSIKARLCPLELVPVAVGQSQTNSDRQEHFELLPPCCLCSLPITNFDDGIVFSLREDVRQEQSHQLGPIVGGADEALILTAPDAVHAGHKECGDKASASGQLNLSFIAPLSAILKEPRRF